MEDRHSKTARRLFSLTCAALSLNCASVRTIGPNATVDLRGVIRDPEGIGVPNVRVFLDYADDDRRMGPSIPTDRKGAFHVRVRPGRYAVSIEASRARVPAVKLDTIQLDPPRQRFDYQYRGLKMQGRFSGPGGKPIKSGFIQAFADHPHISLEAPVVNGRYTLFGPPTRFLFSGNASSPSGVPSIPAAYIPVSTDTTIDFSVDGNEVKGNVMLGAGAIRGASVDVSGLSEAGVPISAQDRTRRDGSFRVYLPPGDYQFIVVPAQAFVARRVFARKVTGSEPVRLVMSRTEWRGIVSDSITGSPIAAVRVVASEIGGSTGAESVSDRKGRFRLVLQTGVVYDLSLSSYRKRIVAKRVAGIGAGRDSTFDLRARVENP